MRKTSLNKKERRERKENTGKQTKQVTAKERRGILLTTENAKRTWKSRILTTKNAENQKEGVILYLYVFFAFFAVKISFPCVAVAVYAIFVFNLSFFSFRLCDLCVL